MCTTIPNQSHALPEPFAYNEQSIHMVSQSIKVEEETPAQHCGQGMYEQSNPH